MSTTEAPIEAQNPEMPFSITKIPVCDDTHAFLEFQKQYPEFSFCPYLAYKDSEGWEKSTSRVYMNKVIPRFAYVPVNVPKADFQELTRFFDATAIDQSVVAINITQPHKSNHILMERFGRDEDSPSNIDTLIRNDQGKLVPFDLNAPSFMDWYAEEVGTMKGKKVILVGVGGVGEPIAKRIANTNMEELVLVDPTNKDKLMKELRTANKVSYASSIAKVKLDGNNLIVINAAGKEGATEESGLLKLLDKYKATKGIFVDIRPQLEIEVVEEAKKLGWNSYTGHGMNARNDYSLLKGICSVMKVEPLPFDKFRELVVSAS